MILLLLVVSFGIGLSLLYGWALEFMIVRSMRLSDDHDLHFSITILLGMATLSGLVGIWSFFWGVGTRAAAVFSLLALLTLAGTRKYALVRLRVFYNQLRSSSVVSRLFFLAFSISAFYYGVAGSVTYDTGLYYGQAIHWIESFRVVPGLANLHIRLGFNSSIFLLAAFWGFVGFGWQLYQVPGLICFLALTAYCLHLMENSRRVLAFSGITALGFLVYILFVRLMSWLASPTTDIPVALIGWLVFLLTMEKVETGRLGQADLHTLAILVLSLFDVTIKLSALPILLIPAYLLWKARASFPFKGAAALVFLSSVILLSWAVRNIVLTGYLIFPFAQLDVFRFRWKVPPELVNDQMIFIAGWARLPSQDPHLVVSMPLDQWLPIWYGMLSASDLVLVIGILGGLVLLPISAAVNRQIPSQVRSYGLGYAVGLIGVIFWFLQAPSPRFGYEFLVPLLLLLYAPAGRLLLGLRDFTGKQFIPILQALLAVLVLTVFTPFRLNVWRRYLFSVKPYPQIETTSFRVGNQALFLPVSDSRCWYDAFPCAPAEVPGLTMCGPSLQDGFCIPQK